VDALTWAMTELMLNDPSESDVLFV
jgi:hypothetical protein